MASILSQTILYAFGPFFCYPWKPVVNALAGDRYGSAYKNFRRDHSHPVNLSLHGICLFFQLFANFMLLSEVDGSALLRPLVHLSGVARPLSLLTLIAWCVCLDLAPAPILVSALSTAALFTAYWCAPWLMDGATLELVVTTSFALVLAVGLWLVPPRTKVAASPKVYAKIVAIAAAWLLWPFLWRAAEARWGGHLVQLGYVDQANVALAVFLLLCAASPFVPEAPAIGGALACRVVAVLTGQPVAFLLGAAFTAPLLQGTAHKLTGEVATLINHNRTGEHHTRDIKVRLEWAHVTFFPSLAFHSICQSLALVR